MTSNVRPALFIDAMNLFARHYIRHPGMSAHGHHAGGIVGFLNQLKFLVEMIHPSYVAVIWEGGGSLRRRAIFPDYKKNRKPPRLNRYYEGDIPDTKENRIYQIKVLVEILKELPICQIFIEDAEADDVIGYLCKYKFQDRSKIVASSDKDFYQLVDDSTRIYSWTSKKFIGAADVLKETGIASHNFAVAKSFAGDASDGIPGVKGVHFKTLAKRFPQLSSDEECSIEEILKECEKLRPEGLKTIESICESKDLIKRNWRLMYLDMANMAAVQVKKVDAVITSYTASKNKLKLMKKLIDEGLPTLDVHDLFSAFQML